jgi:hypothetical protein
MLEQNALGGQIRNILERLVQRERYELDVGVVAEDIIGRWGRGEGERGGVDFEEVERAEEDPEVGYSRVEGAEG